MEITGEVTQVLETKTGQGAKGEWQKQDIIVQPEGQYAKPICVTLWGDKVNSAGVGDRVTVGINIESREYNSKWYTDIKGWKVEGGTGHKEHQGPGDMYKPSGNVSGPTQEEIDDITNDLPFVVSIPLILSMMLYF